VPQTEPFAAASDKMANSWQNALVAKVVAQERGLGRLLELHAVNWIGDNRISDGQ
jgi:hypothetical protein